MSELSDYMRSAALERQEKTLTKVVDFFPPFTTMNERIYLGVNSWSLPDRHERWVRPGGYYVTENGIQTAGEIARDYLDFKFPKRLRATRAQKDALNIHRSAPLYVEPTILEDAAYVDLKSAFWSIMQLVGWNVDYHPSKWILRGTIPHDFPYPDNKAARNSLVSCGLPTPLRMWTGKKVTRRFATNIHINMGLWALIMDTLHAIASHARELDACYVHTDGYILPRWNAEDLIDKIASYGLHASIKARGVGTIIGMGNWKVGDNITKNYMKQWSLMGGVDYIYQVQREQIRDKLMDCKENYHTLIARRVSSSVREYK